MTKQIPEQARQRLIARREAHQEFEQLSKCYWQLREHMTAEAISLAWILLGDKMWERSNFQTTGRSKQ